MNGASQDCCFRNFPIGGVVYAGTNLRSGFRSDISSWAQLAAIPTYGATLPVSISWYDPLVPILRDVVLQLSSLATDTANGVQRPNDYTTAVWIQIGYAG